MKTDLEQLKYFLKARFEFIWIDSYEEVEVMKELKKLITADFEGGSLFTWSMTSGLKKEPLAMHEKNNPPNASLKDPFNVLTKIEEVQALTTPPQFFLLKDFHQPLENIVTLRRKVRDIKELNKKTQTYAPIIVVAPSLYIPTELEKMIHVVNFDIPSEEKVFKYVNSLATAMKKKNEKREAEGTNDCSEPTLVPSEEQIQQITKALCGLTMKEISETLSLSLVEHREMSLDTVLEQKIQLIEKAGVLDYKIPKARFEDIGGNQNFKTWISEVEEAMTPEAREFGCAAPKGYLALGIPGTSKSYAAEALANKFGVPFIKLEMSRIMDKLVGNSEKKMEQALRIVKSCAPCVFLVDEIEKALGGISSSNSSDSGTTARCFGNLLQFLQDNEEVFVIMTSNDVSQLPPELTRAGRLDAMWYFSLPTEEERQDIFKIHLNKTNKQYDQKMLKKVAKESANYTGAEIETVVKASLWKAFKRFKEDGNNSITKEDVLSSIKEVVPIYESSKEKILFLEDWVKGRARYSNDIIDSNGYDTRLDKDVLEELSLDF